MKDMGSAHFFLGVEIGRRPDGGYLMIQEGEELDMSDIPYQSLVGSLMYLAVCTRPDLAAVSLLNWYSQNPMEHWEVAKRVLRYIKGTVSEGLAYNLGEEVVTVMLFMTATTRQRTVDGDLSS